jgi:hypothetical protein
MKRYKKYKFENTIFLDILVFSSADLKRCLSGLGKNSVISLKAKINVKYTERLSTYREVNTLGHTYKKTS